MLSNYFSTVSDPRVSGRCLHLLSDILLIGLCTYLTGGADYEDMHLFAKERGCELGDLVSLPNGAPSEDTFRRVFTRINPDELLSALMAYGNDILSDLREKQIALDGKKLRGASPHSKGNDGLYLMSAWVCENCFCIAQEKVGDKSNEITAIPIVLENIDITDSIVSIDAIGCQREIAETIVEKGGHYLLAVKENQEALLEDVSCAFKMHDGVDVRETFDIGHGRTETRRCSILPADKYLMEETLSAWKNLSTIIRVECVRNTREAQTREVRYYISDENETSASYYLSLARGHWGIENQLHWHLDVTFKEDDSRVRNGYAPQNLSILRKLALQIVSSQKDRLSLRKRLYKAALDVRYLKKLLKMKP